MKFLSHYIVEAFLLSSSKTIPPPESVFRKSPPLLPMYVPVIEKSDIRPGKISSVILAQEPMILYLDETTKPTAQIQAMYGICPHQGASLSKGTVNRLSGCVKCPYHGFNFKSGTGYKIPTKEKITIPTLKVYSDKEWVYVLPELDSENVHETPLPYQPPEEYDPAFVSVSGTVTIHKNCDVITENVLDMLHVSYIHYFGNQDYPLPSNITYAEISNTSGRTYFNYRAGSKSISKVIGKAKMLYVENEFHLPSTTITRVRVNEEGMTKTILTRASPISDEKTILFYKVYRNFWCGNSIEEWLGNWIMKFAMRQTLTEDVWILKQVDTSKRLLGFSTIYDITIDAFRKAKAKAFLSKKNK